MTLGIEADEENIDWIGVYSVKFGLSEEERELLGAI